VIAIVGMGGVGRLNWQFVCSTTFSEFRQWFWGCLLDWW
jgi:hypothetical protein